jgi:hypothetical protein
MTRQETLKAKVTAILQASSTLPPFKVGFSLSSRLEDVFSGAFYLFQILDRLTTSGRVTGIGSATDVGVIDSELKPTVRRLCESHRDVFLAADADRLNDALCDSINALMEFIRDQIPPSKDAEYESYRSNIGHRKIEHGVAMVAAAARP